LHRRGTAGREEVGVAEGSPGGRGPGAEATLRDRESARLEGGGPGSGKCQGQAAGAPCPSGSHHAGYCRRVGVRGSATRVRGPAGGLADPLGGDVGHGLEGVFVEQGCRDSGSGGGRV
ncbi:unnamed protein product, partial [Ectocarpus sp. 12 AP-2014]